MVDTNEENDIDVSLEMKVGRQIALSSDNRSAKKIAKCVANSVRVVVSFFSFSL